MNAWVLLFIVLGWLLLVLGLGFLYPLVSIIGNSMYPLLTDGTLRLSKRVFRYEKIKVGKVYCFTNPDGRLNVKRCIDVSGDKKKAFFQGDNFADSRDSRTYGWIKTNQVISQLIIKEDEASEYK